MRSQHGWVAQVERSWSVRWRLRGWLRGRLRGRLGAGLAEHTGNYSIWRRRARTGDTAAPRRLDESIAPPGQAQIFLRPLKRWGKRRGRVFTECLLLQTTSIRCDEVVMEAILRNNMDCEDESLLLMSSLCHNVCIYLGAVWADWVCYALVFLVICLHVLYQMAQVR